jgi:hypothetical protein
VLGFACCTAPNSRMVVLSSNDKQSSTIMTESVRFSGENLTPRPFTTILRWATQKGNWKIASTTPSSLRTFFDPREVFVGLFSVPFPLERTELPSQFKRECPNEEDSFVELLIHNHRSPLLLLFGKCRKQGSASSVDFILHFHGH